MLNLFWPNIKFNSLRIMEPDTESSPFQSPKRRKNKQRKYPDFSTMIDEISISQNKASFNSDDCLDRISYLRRGRTSGAFSFYSKKS